jgi:signal recognition particle subunit SRP19
VVLLAKGSTETYVIYPEYFNNQISRSSGRRVPRSMAVQDPRSEDILAVCKKLGLSPVLESEKPHPSDWNKADGRVKVLKKFPKEATLKMIAQRLMKKA